MGTRRDQPESETEAKTSSERGGQSKESDSGSRGGPVTALQRELGNQALQTLAEQGAIQPNLKVSSPDDPAEHEAEQVTDQVMQASDDRQEPPVTDQKGEMASTNRGASPTERERDVSGGGRTTSTSRPAAIPTQDRTPRIDESPRSGGAAGDQQASEGVERALESTAGGRPLPPAARSFFESRFGRDFSDVRVHTGRKATDLNRSLNAKAFTHGTDVYVGDGQYNPESMAGKQLLAHELTHVIQQTGHGETVRRTRSNTIQRTPDPSEENDSLLESHIDLGPDGYTKNGGTVIGNIYFESGGSRLSSDEKSLLSELRSDLVDLKKGRNRTFQFEFVGWAYEGEKDTARESYELASMRAMAVERGLKGEADFSTETSAELDPFEGKASRRVEVIAKPPITEPVEIPEPPKKKEKSLKLLDTGLWNSVYHKWMGQGGQVMRFEVTNMAYPFMNAGFYIKASGGAEPTETKSTGMFSVDETKMFEFTAFGPEPIPWRFDIGPIRGDARMMAWRLYSTWHPSGQRSRSGSVTQRPF